MKKNKSFVRIVPSLLIAILLMIPVKSNAQVMYKRWNTFDINKIANKFSNFGSISEGQFEYGIGKHPAMEYPIGSGADYGMAIGFYLAGFSEDAGGENPDGLWYFDPTLSEYKGNWDSDHWDPYGAGPYENQVPLDAAYNFVGKSQLAAMSDEPESWPDPSNSDGRYGWPEFFPNSGDAVLLNENGWPGWGPNGEQLGHQESFGVSYTVNHSAEVPPERWLKAQMIFRGMAFEGKLYENYIFWSYAVTNIGTKPIIDCYFGMRMDYAFIWNRNEVSEEIQAFDEQRQMAYAYNPTGNHFTESGIPVSPTAFGGLIFLKTPKNDAGEETGITNLSWHLDPGGGDDAHIMNDTYIRSVTNQGSPYDSDGDGIDDTQIIDGVAYHYGWTPSGWTEAGLSMISCGPITLQPGETDTLIVCTVLGQNLLDLRKNADRAINLYQAGFQIAKPPVEPIVKAIGGNKIITLTWGQEAEISPGFEGYRIYRSKDRGTSWGERTITDANGTPIGFVPIAQFDLKDGIVGPSSNPEAAWLDLGSDSGMPETNDEGEYVFVDNDVVNGLTYRYYIAAYNIGTENQPPVENAPVSDPSAEKDNTVQVTPRSPLTNSTLNDIKVVPNPYLSANVFETSSTERELHFTHLPGKCTIRIYNVTGELIKVLNHNNNISEESWNLRTTNNQEVAPGLYFYHVSSTEVSGEKIGKFLIIK